MANNKRTVRRTLIKPSDIWLAVGVVLLAAGVWKFTERIFAPWWPYFTRAVATVAGIVWPVAVIVAALIVLVATWQGGRFAMKGKRLYRSRKSKVAGVAGGMATYFNVDVVVVRIIWIACIVASVGIAIFPYIFLWIIIPLEPVRE